MEGKKCVGILTSGGDAPGMNAAIRAVTRAAIYNGFDVKGIMRGYKGLITDEIIPFQTQNVSNIIQQGGTILKTARCEEFRTPEGRKRRATTRDAILPADIGTGMSFFGRKSEQNIVAVRIISIFTMKSSLNPNI